MTETDSNDPIDFLQLEPVPRTELINIAESTVGIEVCSNVTSNISDKIFLVF